MDDILPSDVAFTDFLATMTPSRVLRTSRPNFRGVELRLFRHERQVRAGKTTHRPITKPKLSRAEIRKSDVYMALKMAREAKAIA